MTKSSHTTLTRRERQIMDVLYRAGRATAAEVRASLPDPPSDSAVRAMLPRVAELCPQQFAASFLSRTRLYPRWVYRLRDAIQWPDPAQRLHRQRRERL